MPVDARGFQLVGDLGGFSQGVGSLISQQINKRLQSKALGGEGITPEQQNLARANLASRDPRAATQIGSILQGDQEQGQELEAKQQQAMASIARTVANAGPDGTIGALQSLIPLLSQDQDLAPLVAEVQDDIQRFSTEPQSVIDEYQTANAFFSKPEAFNQSVGQREFESLISGFTPEEQEQARRVKARIAAPAVGSGAITAATTEGLTEKVAESEAVIAGEKTTATETAKTDVKIGSAERVGRAQERINFLSETGTLEARDRNILKKTSASRVRNIAKAESFRDALQSGLRSSGVGRQAAAFAPIGVWTDQGSFDEIFNSFAEVAARERLKASGEVRPTDADVQGMKAAMFGVGRDEKSNIELLNDFIAEQKDLEAKLSPSAPENPQAAPAQQQPTEIKFLGFE